MARLPFDTTSLERNPILQGAAGEAMANAVVPVGLLSQFGYRRLIERLPNALGLRGRLGPRPMIVVIADSPTGPRRTNVPQDYDDLFFDTSRPYTVAWVMDQYGAAPIRVIAGPPPELPLSDATSRLGTEPRATEIMKMLIDSGQLSALQRVDDMAQNDDVLTEGELLVVVVDNYSTEAAQTVGLSLKEGPLRINAQVSFMGHEVSMMTACHEILHQFGAVDIYGGDQTLNPWLSTMASTGFGVANDRRSVELDPWHRMQFGLTAPTVIDFATQPNGQVTVPSVARNREASAVLFWDSRQSKSDFFLIELREQVIGAVDAAVPGGFAIWTVHTDALGTPESQAPNIPGVANFGPDLVDGSGRTWQNGEQTPVLHSADGSSTGLTLSFARPLTDTGTITWSTKAIEPPPHDIPIIPVR